MDPETTKKLRGTDPRKIYVHTGQLLLMEQRAGLPLKEKEKISYVAGDGLSVDREGAMPSRDQQEAVGGKPSGLAKILGGGFVNKATGGQCLVGGIRGEFADVLRLHGRLPSFFYSIARTGQKNKKKWDISINIWNFSIDLGGKA